MCVIGKMAGTAVRIANIVLENEYTKLRNNGKLIFRAISLFFFFLKNPSNLLMSSLINPDL